MLRGVARYLRIVQPSGTCLHLQEVQMYTTDGTQAIDLTANMNCMAGKGYCNEAFYCVDGDASTTCHKNCEAGGWLEIDMGALSCFCPCISTMLRHALPSYRTSLHVGSLIRIGAIEIINRPGQLARIVGSSISLWSEQGGTGTLVWQDTFYAPDSTFSFAVAPCDASTVIENAAGLGLNQGRKFRPTARAFNDKV